MNIFVIFIFLASFPAIAIDHQPSSHSDKGLGSIMGAAEKFWAPKRTLKEEWEADFQGMMKTIFNNKSEDSKVQQALESRETFLKKLLILLITNPPRVAYTNSPLSKGNKPQGKNSVTSPLNYTYDPHIPLVSYLMHGRRIMLYILGDKDFPKKLMEHKGLPHAYQKRLAASHGTTYKNGEVIEVKLGGVVGTAKNLAYGVTGHHFGINIPLGGYGNLGLAKLLGIDNKKSPYSVEIAKAGKNVTNTHNILTVPYYINYDGSVQINRALLGWIKENVDNKNQRTVFEKLKKIQQGHIYVFVRNFGKKPLSPHMMTYFENSFPQVRTQTIQETGSMLIGIEGSAPGKSTMFGTEHNAASAAKDSSLDPSILNGKKFEKLSPLNVPLGYGGMVVFLSPSRVGVWEKTCKEILSKPVADQKKYFEFHLRRSAREISDRMGLTQKLKNDANINFKKKS